MSRMMIRCVAAGLMSMGLGAAVRAGTTAATFDFEDQAYTAPGGVTTLTVSNSGLSLTIDRVGQAFDVVNLSSLSGTGSFGTHTLSPTPPGQNFFNVNFSQAVSSFSVQVGDFTGAGPTDNLALTAFSGINGTGTNLGTTSDTLPLINATTFASKTITFSGSNIRSVEFIGGDSVSANSVYYDNFGATFTTSSGTGGGSGGNGGGGSSAVPLPPAFFVAPLGALVAWYGARRLRSPAGRA